MKHCWIAISFFFLSACGGGGGGDSNDETSVIRNSSLQTVSISSLVSSVSSSASLALQSSNSIQSSRSSSYTRQTSTSSSTSISISSSLSSNNGFVFFQDSSVKEAVRIQLNLSPNSDITPLQMESLTQLTLENPTSLVGLETAINLVRLDASNSTDSMTALELSPIQNLTKIENLYVTKFNLGDLSSIQKLTAIDYLDLSQSSFTNLNAISAFTKLVTLSLTNTNTSSLPSGFSNLLKLNRLYLSENPLTNAGITPIHGLPIRRLIISYTDINDISFLSSKSQLDYLSVTGSPVYDLSPLITSGLGLNETLYANYSCVHLGKYSTNSSYITQLENRGVNVFNDYQNEGLYGDEDKPCTNLLNNLQTMSSATYSPTDLQINWSFNNTNNQSLTCEIFADLQGQQPRTPLAIINNCHLTNQHTLATVFTNAPISIDVWNGYGSHKLFSSTVSNTTPVTAYLHSYDWGQTVVKNDSKLIPNKNALLRLHILNSTTIAAPDIQVVASLNAINTPLTVQKPSQLLSTKNFNSLTQSYNAVIDKSLMQPGLSIVVTIGNQTKTITPQWGVANKLNITLVPIKITTSTGMIPDHNSIKNAFLEAWPLSEINLQNRTAFTSTADSADDMENVLYEISELQTLDGDNSHYYGFFSDDVYDLLDFNDFGGIAFRPGTTGIGSDRDPNFSIMLHELGHSFSLQHINCGGPTDFDSRFPYNTNSMGSLGINLNLTSLRLPNSYRDMMSYCSPEFVSDYSYEKAQDYLEENPSKAFRVVNSQKISANIERNWFISGSISSDHSITLRRLLPINRQSSPQKSGQYQVLITDTQGKIYSQYFDAKELDHPAAKTEKFFSVFMPYTDIAKLEIYQGTTKIFTQAESTSLTSANQQLQKNTRTVLVTRSHQEVCLDWDNTNYDSATLIFHQEQLQSTLFMDTRDDHSCVDFDQPGKNIQWQILLRKNLSVDEFWQND